MEPTADPMWTEDKFWPTEILFKVKLTHAKA